jgi:ribosomal protein S4
VLKRGLANTPHQARQFISHGHIVVGDRVVTVPGYIVKKDEEATVGILPRSAFSDPNHPARMTPQKKEETRLLEELRKKKETAASAAEPAPVIEEKDIKEVEASKEDAS